MWDAPASSALRSGEFQATWLESDEEIRQALASRQVCQAAPARPTPAYAHRADAEVQPERPVQRPPMALLCILDDGRQEGEWVRLRADRTIIGRTEGDVLIPHDGLVSGRHAELVRRPASSGYRWVLIDLRSTNGSFVRISNTLLRHESELLIGSGRYRFEMGGSAARATTQGEAQRQTTEAWSDSSVRALVPSLVELSPAGPVQRLPLTLPEYWIGRDAKACAIDRPGDVLTSPRHVRLYRDAKSQWHAESNKPLNGLWLSVDEIVLGNACQFRLGEQKFLFRGL
jgi:hypothetical protein